MQDISNLITLANDPEILKFQAPVIYPILSEHAEEWIKKCEQNCRTNPRSDYAFAIEMQEKRMLIGGIELRDVNKYPKTATIGYWIGKAHWNNGYATEAIREMIDLGFGDLNLGRINAEADTKNTASHRILVEFGFKLEGTRQKFTKVESTGEWADYNMYGMLKQN